MSEIDEDILGDDVDEFFGQDGDEIDMTLEMSLGDCCACRGTSSAENRVRNIVMHDFPAPVPGTGWGCIVCHLPMDGAVSVICDRCRDTHAPILDVCSGFPKENQRLALSGMVKTPFAHHLALHPMI